MAGVTGMVSAALSALNAERHSGTESADDSAARLYRDTVRTFTPRRPEGPTGRGYHKKTVKIRMFLLKDPMEMVPSPRDQHILEQMGLGIPLDLTGYYFGKASKNRKIEKIEFKSVPSLKKKLNKGKLFLVPRSSLTGSRTFDNSQQTEENDEELTELEEVNNSQQTEVNDEELTELEEVKTCTMINLLFYAHAHKHMNLVRDITFEPLRVLTLN